MFSGRQEQPFVCQTAGFHTLAGSDLGAPTDAACSVPTKVEYVYRSSTDRKLKPLADPADRPADLGRALLEEGFRATGTEPGMALNLERLTAVPETPREFHIERARTEASVRKFGELIGEPCAYGVDLDHRGRCRVLAQSRRQRRSERLTGTGDRDALSSPTANPATAFSHRPILTPTVGL